MFEHLKTFEETLESADKLNPFLSAGYVVVDNHFNRLGFKCRQYVAVECTIGFSNTGFGPMNLNADSIERAGMIDLIRWQPKLEEFLFYFPRWLPLYQQLLPLYLEYCKGVEEKYHNLLKEIEEEEEKKTGKEVEESGNEGNNENDSEKKGFVRAFATKAREFGTVKAILFELKKGTVLSVQEYIQVTRNKAIVADFLQHMNKQDIKDAEKEDEEEKERKE